MSHVYNTLSLAAQPAKKGATRAYVAASVDNRVSALNISDPDDIRYVSYAFTQLDNPTDVVYDANRKLIFSTSTHDNEIVCFDASTDSLAFKDNLVSSSNVDDVRYLALDINRNILFGVSDDLNQLCSYDVSDPTNITFLHKTGSTNLLGNSPRLFWLDIDNHLSFHHNSTDESMTIYDTSNPKALTFLSEKTSTRFAGAHAEKTMIIQPEHRRFWIFGQGTSGNNRKLSAWDYSDPKDIQELGTLDVTYDPGGGDYVYWAFYDKALNTIISGGNDTETQRFWDLSTVPPTGTEFTKPSSFWSTSELGWHYDPYSRAVYSVETGSDRFHSYIVDVVDSTVAYADNLTSNQIVDGAQGFCLNTYGPAASRAWSASYE